MERLSRRQCQIAMNVVIDSFIDKIKRKEKNDLHQIKSSLSKSPLQSSTSTLYNDTETFLKVYNNDQRSQAIFQQEYKAYKFLNEIPELEKYIPRLLESSTSKRNCFLLVENRGIDALELINSKHIDMDFNTWVKFLRDISHAISILHEHDATHGDVKPENVTYDTKTKSWSLIDFGFTYQNLSTPLRFYGTIPYCSPHICVEYIKIRTATHSSVKSSVVNDLFSFAMTALSMFGYYFEVETTPQMSYSVTNLVKIYNGDIDGLYHRYIPKNTVPNATTKRIIKLLASMVLTQIDTSFSEVIWRKGQCRCFFSGHNPVPCDLDDYDIAKYWSELITIIRN